MLTFLLFVIGAVLWVSGVWCCLVEEVTLFEIFRILVGGQIVKIWYSALQSKDEDEKVERIIKAIKNKWS